MNLGLNGNQAAETRPAIDPFIEPIRNAHIAVRKGEKDLLEKAHFIGDKLRALKESKAGKWKKWFKERKDQFGFSYTKATRYMLISEYWPGCKDKGNIRDAWEEAVRLDAETKGKTREDREDGKQRGIADDSCKGPRPLDWKKWLVRQRRTIRKFEIGLNSKEEYEEFRRELNAFVKELDKILYYK